MKPAGQRWIIYPDEKASLYIYGFSDWHLGNKGTCKKRLAADIEEVRCDPYIFWLGAGDYAEYIKPSDPRFDPDAVDEDIKVSELGKLGAALTARVAAMARPIKHKCLGMGYGNHEDGFMLRQAQQGMHDAMCEHLGVPNLEYGAFFDVIFVHDKRAAAPGLRFTPPKRGKETWRLRIVVHHGAGYSQTKGGKINTLHRVLQRFDCDLAFIGHLHDKMGLHAVRLRANATCEDIEEQTQKAVMCGTYLRTYAPGVVTYGEKRMYEPTPFGPGVARIRPCTKTMKVEL